MNSRIEYNINSGGSNKNPISPIVGLVFFIVIMVGFYYLTSLIWKILSFLTPVMLIATAIIDYKVILNYGKWIWKLGKKNWVAGLGAGILSVLGIPFVSAFLLSKALMSRKVKKMTGEFEKQSKPSFTEFEDISTTEPTENPEADVRILELEEPEKKSKEKNQYDNYFEDIEVEEEKPKKNLWD